MLGTRRLGSATAASRRRHACKCVSSVALTSQGGFAEVAEPATEEETLVLSKLEEMALEELMRMLEHKASTHTIV